jgi:hypothetical protein
MIGLTDFLIEPSFFMTHINLMLKYGVLLGDGADGTRPKDK